MMGRVLTSRIANITLAGGAALCLWVGPAQAASDIPLPAPRPTAPAAKTLSPLPAMRPLNAVPLVPLGFQKPPAPVPDAPTRSLAPQHASIPAKHQVPLARAKTAATSPADIALLKRAINLAQADKSSSATEIAKTIHDPLARKLAEWVILRSDDSSLPFSRYAAFISANPGWPNIAYLRRHAEAVLWQDQVEAGTVRAFFAKSAPQTAKGHFALARALLAAGDKTGAQRHVREAWRDHDFSTSLEREALAAFGKLLTAADHKARMETRLYADDIAAGLRAAKHLGKAEMAIARAWVAVIRRSRHAKHLLHTVPASARHDAGYLYSRIKWLRRHDKDAEAARLLHAAPRQIAKIINPDEWWIERRLVARSLLEKGEPRAAYRVVVEAVQPTKENYRAESQFMAGWIALRFLHDAATAQRHFARVALGIDNPITRARAAYWQGRAAEAARKRAEARRHYREAAQYSTAYYGQLARAKLDLTNIVLGRPPLPTGQRRADIERLEIVRAAKLLYAVGEKDLSASFGYNLAGRLNNSAVLAVLADIARKNGDARATSLIGKVALGRGMPLAIHAFPNFGIPHYKRIGPALARPVVYAIARQESTFNQRVVSRAKAMGLMQVTPGAGRDTARRFNIKYSLHRLHSDPVYNVQMGAAELGALMQEYRGSYILTFVGYNAGRGRVREWIKRFGDPRDPKVDPIDWVERIPFSETRNYVERVLENLQVYRTLFSGNNKLKIEADLRRGTVAN